MKDKKEECGSKESKESAAQNPGVQNAERYPGS